MPPTIHDLAPEILSHIFEIGDRNSTNNYGSSQRAFLRAASLVCRRWRGPAQSTLWRRVEVCDSGTATAFTESGGTLRGVVTKEMRFLECDSRDVKRVFEAMAGGIEGVEFWMDDELDARVLQCESLKDLSKLEFGQIKFTATDSASPNEELSLPFRLSQLRIQFELKFSPHLLAAILSPSLTSLDLGFDNCAKANFPLLHQFVVPHAPNLVELTLSGTSSKSRTKAFLLELFQQCFSLRRLCCDAFCLDFMSELSSVDLRFLKIGGSSGPCLTDEVQKLAGMLAGSGASAAGPEALKRLQNLKIKVAEDEIDWDRVEDLITNCKGRHIGLEWDIDPRVMEEWDSDLEHMGLSSWAQLADQFNRDSDPEPWPSSDSDEST